MARQDEIAVRSPIRRALPTFTDSLIEPLSRFRNEVDRLFDDLPGRWPPFQLAGRLLVPSVEMTETGKAYKLSVEVPGMEATDIDMQVDDNAIVISGEKKDQREEEETSYSYSERSYGAFERRIELPKDADAKSIKAKVRNGVLQVTVPKDLKAANSKRRIAVEAA